MGVKVSVVIATYAPGKRIDGLVRSLESQTLPASEFEVIFVDDGSPDDTWSRLEEIRDAHPNVRIERIENSGWPSRPRNIGLDLAEGEYVLFMDHDDHLYPRGLSSGWDFAQAGNLDIVSVKETKSSSPGFGFDAYLADASGTAAEMGIMSLVPMMPHKLYRRRLLVDGAVRFPERRQAFWEDVFFNVDAFVHAERVGTLAHQAVYRRNMGKSNASSSYRPQFEHFWTKLELVFEHIEATLAGDRWTTDRAALLTHQYRGRVLTSVRALLAHGHEDGFRMALPYVRAIQERWVDAEQARTLTRLEQRVDTLLRTGDLDALRTLSKAASSVVGVTRLTTAAWDGGDLVLSGETSWHRSSAPAARGLLAPEAESGAADLAQDVAKARSRLVLRHRRTIETHVLESEIDSATYDRHDPVRTLTLQTTTRLPVAGSPLEDVHDIQANNSALGFVNQRGVRNKQVTLVGLIEGRAVVAYPNTRGTLSIDYDQRLRCVVNSSRPAHRRATVTASGDELAAILPLDDVHVWGRTRLAGNVTLVSLDDSSVRSTPCPSTLVGDEQGARVEMRLPVPRPGRHRLVFDINGRTVASNTVLAVPRRWRRPHLTRM